MRDALFWEKAVDGAIVTDRTGHVLWANPAASTIFRASNPNEMSHLTITALVSDEEKAEMEEDLDALRGNQHVYRVCRFLDRQGKTFDTTLEAVQIQGDALFFTVRNPKTNPIPNTTPQKPLDYMPQVVRRALSMPTEDGPGIHVTQKGRIRVHGDNDSQADNLLPFTRRILKEFDRLGEKISEISQSVTRVQTLQETTMRDQERLERRVAQLEARPDCSSCRSTASIEIVKARLETHDMQLRRMEDRVEKHRDRTDDRIERSWEVPIIDRKMEKIADQNTQAWLFMQSKWALLAGAIGLIGIVGALVTIFTAIF